MASPDLLRGVSPPTQKRRVSVGGAAGDIGLKPATPPILQSSVEFRGVDAKALRTTQEQMELKKKIHDAQSSTSNEEDHHILHRRLSIDEESDGSDSDESGVDSKIQDIVTRSSFAHGTHSPRSMTRLIGREMQAEINATRKKELKEEAIKVRDKEKAKQEERKELPKGGVSVKSLRHDTLENAEMKNLIHDLEEREQQRVCSGGSRDGSPGSVTRSTKEEKLEEMAPYPGGVSVRELRHDTVENAQMKGIIHNLEEREQKRKNSRQAEERKKGEVRACESRNNKLSPLTSYFARRRLRRNLLSAKALLHLEELASGTSDTTLLRTPK